MLDNTTDTPEDNTDAEHSFTCRICQKSQFPFQIANFDGVDFTSCQECGSVSSLPYPDEAEILGTLTTSRIAQDRPFPNNFEKRHFKKHLTDLQRAAKGPNLIDLHCHNGYRTELIRQNTKFTPAGIDPNPFSIEIAKKRFQKVPFETSTASDLDGQKFDAAVSYHGLETTSDPNEYLTTLKTILNPKAAVLFTLCDGNHFMVPSNFLNWREVYYPRRVHYFSRKGLETILNRNGFKVLKRYGRFLPYQHVIARFVRP